MSERRSYRQGRIIWGYLRSNLTRKREMHPAVILDRDEDITQPERFDPRQPPHENVVHVIGVSTKHKRYRFPYVALPFSADGRSTTRLREDCGAIIGWYDRLAIPDDVTGRNGGFGGDVPPGVMREIIEAVRQDLVAKVGVQFDTVRRMLEELLGEDP